MLSTILRCSTSSAISRAVQCVMGRSDASGFSQANASIRQRWSAVILAGAPGRGASARRSSRLKSSSEISCSLIQRLRHNRTVSCVTCSFLAISTLGFPSAAANTILARMAICCAVWCRFTNFSTLVVLVLKVRLAVLWDLAFPVSLIGQILPHPTTPKLFQPGCTTAVKNTY